MDVISQRISKMTFFTDGVKNVFKCSMWSLKFIVLSPVKDLVKIICNCSEPSGFMFKSAEHACMNEHS